MTVQDPSTSPPRLDGQLYPFRSRFVEIEVQDNAPEQICEALVAFHDQRSLSRNEDRVSRPLVREPAGRPDTFGKRRRGPRCCPIEVFLKANP